MSSLKAFFIASTGRPGPVVIDIAKDVFTTQIEYEYPENVHLRGYSGDFTGKEQEIDAVVEAVGILEEKAKGCAPKERGEE